MRRRTPPTAIQPDRATRSCQVPRRSRWGTVRWRGFECFVPSSPRASASSRTSDAPLLLDRRGWLLWAGSRGRGSWPTIAAMSAFFCSHHFTVLPPSPDTVPFLKTRGRATSSLPSINKSQVTSSHFPTTSCQNIWFSRRFHSILVHQELGASLWLVPASTTAQHSSDKGTPSPARWLSQEPDAPGLALHREGCPAAGWDLSSRASKRTSSCSNTNSAKLHPRGNHRSPEPDRTGWSCLAENGLVVRLPVRRVACSLVSERVPVPHPGITDGRVEARG